MSKSFMPLTLLSIAALAFVASAPRAQASDETGDTAIEIKANLDAADCTATPPTITVLGLNIDVTGASGEAEDSGDDDPPPAPGGANACSALVVGSPVEVKLASDVVPLEASEAEPSDGDEVSIQAQVQAFDATAQTVTVLGLTVDVSGATLDGSDDDSQDDSGSQPIDLSQLVVGQFVELKLDPAQLPALHATSLELKNFTNQIEVEIEDQQGNPIDDSSDDIQIDVAVKIAPSGAGKGAGSQSAAKRTFHLQRSASGGFLLTGLPTGKATIRATRIAGGTQSAGKDNVKVKPNATRTAVITLRKTHAK